MDVKFTLGLDFPNLPYYMEKNVISVLLNIWTTFEEKFPGCNAQNTRRWVWPARTRSSGTSVARTTCAGARNRRWSALIWLQSKSWIWGEVCSCTTKIVEVDQSLFAFLLNFFYRNNAVHLFYDRDGFETRLGEFWWKSFPWIAHLTQETTWKSSNWLWRQSPTSLATGSKSTSSLNLQTNFTVSHIYVGTCGPWQKTCVCASIMSGLIVMTIMYCLDPGWRETRSPSQTSICELFPLAPQQQS